MNKKSIFKLTAFLLILGLIIYLRSMGFDKILSFENFKSNREYLLSLVNNHYLFSVFIFITIYIGNVISSLPLVALQTVIGGFLFGAVPATIYTIISATVGSAIAFLIFRYFLGQKIQQKYGEKLKNFNKNIEKYGSNYLLIINLIGLVPFFVVNSLAALTNISLKTFICTTAIGIIPSTFVFAYAGRELGNINSLKEIISPNILLAFGMLALLGFFSLIIKWYKEKKEQIV